ncbi:acetyltransferase, GNAT family protein [Cryptosporidium felis]|nr:acetyltransferase, GNAT family protein [Cryptosporidium felis]
MALVKKKQRVAKKGATAPNSKNRYNKLLKEISNSEDFFPSLFNDTISKYNNELEKISENSKIKIMKRKELLDVHIDQILQITRNNMKILYDENPWGELWKNGWDDKLKLQELSNEMCCYLIINNENGNVMSKKHFGSDESSSITSNCKMSPEVYIASFLCFRFELEHGINSCNKILVGYIYELQSHIKGKGYGKLLIDLFCEICVKLRINKVMCTVLKENSDAFRFYTSKCGFIVDETSPICEPYFILSRNTRK